jgi:predicted MFS family arabinose efflux permease
VHAAGLRQGWPLAGTLGIQVVATACTLGLPVLSPMVEGFTAADVGTYLAILYLGAIVGGIAGAALVDAHGPVRASQLSLGLQAAGLLLLAMDHAGVRPLGALLCGLGYGPITPASSQILARTTAPLQIGFMFSLKQTGVPLGGLFAGALMPLLATAFSWKAALCVHAILTLAVAVACEGLRSTLDDQPKHSKRVEWLTPIAAVLRHPQLRVMAGVSLLFSATQMCVSGYLMVYLSHDLGFDLVRAGMLYAAAQAAGMVGRLLWGHLADRTGAPRLVMILVALLMAASAVATSAMTAAWATPALYLVVVCFGASAIAWNGVYLGEVARLSQPGAAAMLTGGALFFAYIGVMTGPPAFGWMAAHAGGMNVAFAWLASLPIIATLLLLRGMLKPPGTAEANSSTVV